MIGGCFCEEKMLEVDSSGRFYDRRRGTQASDTFFLLCKHFLLASLLSEVNGDTQIDYIFFSFLALTIPWGNPPSPLLPLFHYTLIHPPIPPSLNPDTPNSQPFPISSPILPTPPPGENEQGPQMLKALEPLIDTPEHTLDQLLDLHSHPAASKEEETRLYLRLYTTYPHTRPLVAPLVPRNKGFVNSGPLRR